MGDCQPSSLKTNGELAAPSHCCFSSIYKSMYVFVYIKKHRHKIWLGSPGPPPPPLPPPLEDPPGLAPRSKELSVKAKLGPMQPMGPPPKHKMKKPACSSLGETLVEPELPPGIFTRTCFRIFLGTQSKSPSRELAALASFYYFVRHHKLQASGQKTKKATGATTSLRRTNKIGTIIMWKVSQPISNTEFKCFVW